MDFHETTKMPSLDIKEEQKTNVLYHIMPGTVSNQHYMKLIESFSGIPLGQYETKNIAKGIMGFVDEEELVKLTRDNRSPNSLEKNLFK